MSATPLSVLYRLFWNFACVLFMIWGCACDLDIIVRSFFYSFNILNLVILHPQYINSRLPLVSATPLTVLYRSFWNFACVFFIVWGCACSLDIIVRSFFVTFLYCERSHFSPSMYGQRVPLVSASPLTVLYQSLWNFASVFFHGMRICMWFGYNC